MTLNDHLSLSQRNASKVKMAFRRAKDISTQRDSSDED